MWKNKFFLNRGVILGGVLIAGLVLRIWYLSYRLQGINSDEAIIGLMARHILQGEFPFFYYGQLYYGPIDAYLTAPLFLIFGSSELVLRIIPLLASLSFILLIEKLGRELYSPGVGMASAVFSALSPDFLTMRGLLADAAYSILLPLGTLSLLLFIQLLRSPSRRKYWLFVFICLIGIWIFPLMFYYVFALGIYYLLTRAKQSQWGRTKKLLPFRDKAILVVLVITTLFGIFWYAEYIFHRPVLSTVFPILGKMFTVTIPVLLGFFPSGSDASTSLAASKNPAWYNILAVTSGVIIFVIGLTYGYRSYQRGNKLLLLFTITTLIVFSLFCILMNVKLDTFSHPRYLYPLYSTVPLWVYGLGRFLNKCRCPQQMVFIVFLIVNLYGNFTFPVRNINIQPLIEWLSYEGETQYVYTDYWIAYALAFESRESVIPFVINSENRAGLNRYAPYTDEVQNADNPIVVFWSDQPEEVAYRNFLEQNDLHYQENIIGPYTVYSKASSRIYFTQQGLSLVLQQNSKNP